MFVNNRVSSFSGPAADRCRHCNKVSTMARKPYESDTTRFIRDFLQKNPEVVDKQREARSTWWDRPQDREQRRKFEDARLPKKPYEYY
jgi:uncharacterized protein DUF3460